VTNDKEHRRRAVEESGHSFIVEASAGTGKTSTLINRILHLVLNEGPSGPPLRLSQICAITFTEKAAGEMKIRLRQSFEEALGAPASRRYASDADNGGRDGRVPSASLALQALRDLESASISTFHSFAVSLLKERPIEAGLDPHFTALDEIRSELFFREVWDTWISRALAERRPALEKALRSGLSLAALQDLAGVLRLSGQAVRALKYDSPMEENEAQRKIQDLLEQGLAFFKQARKPQDKLLGYLEKAVQWLKSPRPECARPSRPGKAGLSANWAEGKKTLEEVQGFIRETADFCDAYQKLPAQWVLHEVIGWIKEEFMPEWDRRKRAGGLLDFDDQLWLARDLLLKSKAVRREFQGRYATLLVDEFQDTDPVQWDIVRLLSSTDLEERDPACLRPGSGRLFIVGDPKQSIYRFRGADIETYLEIADPGKMHALGLERLLLTTNFRSVPSILRFVDTAFTGVMSVPSDGRYQPDYLPFGDQGDRKAEPQAPSVHLLGDRENINGDSGTVRSFLEREASRIAGLIGRIHGSPSWKIQDSKEKNGGGWRVPRHGDIAILLPVLSRADILEDALREMDIPYVLEGGKFYYARSEVSSAITVLRALANPNDAIALYGALRSIFFGFSDEDLLRVHVQGQRLDYRAQVPSDSPLYYPFEILRDLHLRRHDRRASETFETLIQKTGAREVLASRGFQSLANLNKLSRTLRALQGEGTFSQVIDLLSTMDEEGLAESESRLMEERSDAVRILSIHKSKGLDFPIVIMAALGLKRRNRYKNLLADFHRRKVFGLSIGPKESGLQTPGWKELSDEERKRENAELVRLLYVAMTRARDHLILSTHTQNWKVSENGQQVPDTEGTRLKPISSLIENCLSKETDLVHWLDVGSLDAPKRPRQQPLVETRDLGAVLENEYKELRRILNETPSSRDLQPAGKAKIESGQEDRAPEDRSPEAAGNRSIRLGVAFHEAMERADLFRQEDLTGSARELIARHNLDRDSAGKLVEMVRATLSSGLIGRARAAADSGGRILRELPFVRPLDGGVEEGKIDLLFEESGGWVLVDYKTDWVSTNAEDSEEHFRAKYSGQIREYVDALNALSVKVSSAYLLLARTGAAIQMI
jgi:ATP-dependent helicase/nuclease subunit A